MWKFLKAFLLSQSGQVPAEDQSGEDEREDQNNVDESTEDDLTGLRQPYNEPAANTDQQPVANSNQEQQNNDPSFIEGLNLDPKTFSPENQAIFKKMQGGYTKAMQNAAQLQEKAAMVDRFYNDKDFARQTLLAFATENGYQLSPINQPAGQQGQQQAQAPQTSQELVELLKSKLDPSLHWTAEGSAAAIQAVMGQLLKPVFDMSEAQQKQQKEARQAQVNAEYDREAASFGERQPGWEAHQEKMSKLLTFMTSGDFTHPEFGSKFDLLYQLATSKAAALSEATKRVNRAANNATPTQTNGRRTVQSRPIQDEVADTASNDDAWRKATQHALAQAKGRRR